jgi:hypothetical protein
MTLSQEDVVRAVACSLCGAPAGQWCSLSRARRSGGTIPPGDWRTAHAARQRAALWTIVDDQCAKRQAEGARG